MGETIKTLMVPRGVTFVSKTMLHKRIAFYESYINDLCNMCNTVKQLMFQMFQRGQISRGERVPGRERAPPRAPMTAGLGPPGPQMCANIGPSEALI